MNSPLRACGPQVRLRGLPQPHRPRRTRPGDSSRGYGPAAPKSACADSLNPTGQAPLAPRHVLELAWHATPPSRLKSPRPTHSANKFAAKGSYAATKSLRDWRGGAMEKKCQGERPRAPATRNRLRMCRGGLRAASSVAPALVFGPQNWLAKGLTNGRLSCIVVIATYSTDLLSHPAPTGDN